MPATRASCCVLLSAMQHAPLRPHRREPRIMDWKIPKGFCVSAATSTDTDSSQMPTDSKGTHIAKGARVSAKFEEPDGVCYGTVSVLYSWSSHLHSQGLDRCQRTSTRFAGDKHQGGRDQRPV